LAGCSFHACLVRELREAELGGCGVTAGAELWGWPLLAEIGLLAAMDIDLARLAGLAVAGLGLLAEMGLVDAVETVLTRLEGFSVVGLVGVDDEVINLALLWLLLLLDLLLLAARSALATAHSAAVSLR